MGLEEADAEEEGFCGRIVQEGGGGGCDRCGAVVRQVNHAIVTDGGRVACNMLDADQRRGVARAAQRMDEMLPVVGEDEATMGEAEHPAAMRCLPGQERGAARGAGRGGGAGPPEEDTLLREALEVGRRDSMAVGLHVAPRVVRMDVDDVRSGHRAFLPPHHSAS